MKEYIEREKITQILREEAANQYPTPYHVGLLAAARAIEAIPPADVREVVHGKWLPTGAGRLTERCSACGYKSLETGKLF